MALIAHYRLDGDAKDSVGTFDGTVTGGLTWVDGKLGKAASFNNVGYISDSRVSDYLHGKSEASIALWVKKDSINYGFLQLSGFKSTNGATYPHSTSTNVYLDVFRTDRLGPIEMKSSVLEWHHVVITQSPGIWRIYQNGELVYQTSADTQVSTDYLQFELGRNSDSRYCLGQFDDVRIYDHALSKREVRDLSLGIMAHYKLDGDALDNTGTYSGNENGVMWTEDPSRGLVADFRTVNTRINGSGWPVGEDFSYSFWAKTENTTGLQGLVGNHWHDPNPTGCNLFIRGSILNVATGDGTSRPSYSITPISPVTEWNHYGLSCKNGEIKVYQNSVLLSTLTRVIKQDVIPRGFALGTWAESYAGTYWLTGLLDDVKIYSTALSGTDIKELYEQKASLDSLGNLHTSTFNSTGAKQSLLVNYTTWQDGQTGSVSNFRMNGTTTENYRVIDTDPFGKPTVVWEARPDAVSDPGGGWDFETTKVDITKMYRLSVWVKRSVTGNGTFYFGCNASPTVLNRSNNLTNGNPYFDVRAGLTSEWVLVVGHIWPAGSGLGNNHPDSGRHTLAGKVGDLYFGDFIFSPSTTSLSHRSYLYYSTDIATRQQWCYPRMDICDGTEPSLAELLSGFDSRNEDLFRKYNGGLIPSGVTQNGFVAPTISEVAVADGLVAWYPLMGDTLDYAGRTLATGGHDGAYENKEGIYGASFSGEANNDIIITPQQTIPAGESWTFGGWVNLRKFTSNIYPIFMSADLPYLAVDRSGNNLRCSYRDRAQVDISSSKSLVANKWHHVIAVFEKGKGAYLYCDGELVGSRLSPTTTAGINYVRLGGHSNTSYLIDGLISDFRIYNRALTPEEVATLYNLTKPDGLKMSITKDTIYTRGQFKEVIC